MKKIYKTATVLLILLMIFSNNLGIRLSAAETKEHSWFFKSATGNKQPIVFGGNKSVDEYNVLYMGSPDEKIIYLTFDAGYENGNVQTTLDILKKHSAPAAFFILPALVRSNTELVLRMEDEGHFVCNHTYSHKNIAKISDFETFSSEITKLEKEYNELTGREMKKYFRPPEGAFSMRSLEYADRLGLNTVFWSFAYADWDNNAQKNTDWAKNKIIENFHNGMVMLLHPTSATNAAILDSVLTEAENMGYRFETLDSLLEYKNSQDTSLDYSILTDYKSRGIVLCDNPTMGKKVAFSFDDGPLDSLTPEILDILKENDIKATFFVTGSNVEKSPELLKRIHSEGHQIGNHTYSHCRINKIGSDELRREIEATDKLIYEALGIHTKLFRPPGGYYSVAAIETANRLGYKYVLWSWRLDTRDWAGVSVQNVISTVTENINNGCIVLFHDGVNNNSPTAESLRVLIPKLKLLGYDFVTVSELFENKNL